MSIRDAKEFILKCKDDSLFRRQLYKCSTKQEMLCTAEKQGWIVRVWK